MSVVKSPLVFLYLALLNLVFGASVLAAPKPKCSIDALSPVRHVLLPLTLLEITKLYASSHAKPRAPQKLDLLVSRYLEQNVLPGPGAPRDSLQYGRQLLALSDLSLRGALWIQEAVIARLEKNSATDVQKVAELMRSVRILREAALERLPPQAKPLTVRRSIGEKFLSSPEVPVEQKALYVYLQMGTPDWRGVRILKSVLPAQREQVESILAVRLPLWRVYKEQARRHGIKDYPIDLAVAESLRELPVTGERGWLAETTESNLLYGASGTYTYFTDSSTAPNVLSFDQAAEQIRTNANMPAVGVSLSEARRHLSELSAVARDLGLEMRFQIPSLRTLEKAHLAGAKTEYFFGNNPEDAPLFTNLPKLRLERSSRRSIQQRGF